MQQDNMKKHFLNGATLVFDLDGTLVDTAPDLIATLNFILAEAGLPAAPADKIRPLISFGALRILDESFALFEQKRSEEQLGELFEQFLEHYANNVAVKSAPYPNLIDFLDTTENAGARFGICTNKREGLSRTLLSELGLNDRFKAIVGRDTLDVCKPDPRHLIETILRSGGSEERAIMIGDSATDVNTAKAAGIPVVAVSFGYSDVPVHDLGADAVIDDYTELMAILPELLSR